MIQRITIMTMVKLDGKNRTVKVVGTKTLPFKKKEPAPQGRTKEAGCRYGDMGGADEVNGDCRQQKFPDVSMENREETMEMENGKDHTVNTYIHRQQDGTVHVIGTDPVSRPGMAGAVSRQQAYWKGGEDLCLKR